MPEYYVYILENAKGRLYVGHTDNLERRIRQHNSPEKKAHLGKYTHKNGPWRLLGFDVYPTRAAAVLREKQLKSWKSPSRIRLLLQSSMVESRQGRD